MLQDFFYIKGWYEGPMIMLKFLPRGPCPGWQGATWRINPADISGPEVTLTEVLTDLYLIGPWYGNLDCGVQLDPTLYALEEVYGAERVE